MEQLRRHRIGPGKRTLWYYHKYLMLRHHGNEGRPRAANVYNPKTCRKNGNK